MVYSLGVSTNVSPDGHQLKICVQGRFDFAMHKAFRHAYEGAPGTVRTYVVDMQDTEYLDSSALGMLLILRDYAGGERSDVMITNCNENIKEIFELANFHQCFRFDTQRRPH